MDDTADTRTLKIKVGGNEYAAAPFGQAQVMALQMIRGVEGSTVIKILSGLVKFSMGEKAQGDVLVMLAEGVIDEHGLIQVLMDIAKATAAENEARENTESAGAVPRASLPHPTVPETDSPHDSPIPDTFTGRVKPGAY